MNCELCQIELEDFLYGELSERLADQVRDHLAECAECVAFRSELECEGDLFAQFYEQTAIDPSAEMWQAIRSRIETVPAREHSSEVSIEGKPVWWQSLTGWLLAPAMIRQAALALLLIAVSVAATMLLMRRNNDGQKLAQHNPVESPSPKFTVTPTPSPNTEPADAHVEKPSAPPSSNQRQAQAKPLSDQELLARQLARAEREYQSAIKLLDRAIAKRRETLEPESFRKYESSLALIDSSILQSKRALREQPNDLAAGQFLLAAYARKVELMQEIAMQ